MNRHEYIAYQINIFQYEVNIKTIKTRIQQIAYRYI